MKTPSTTTHSLVPPPADIRTMTQFGKAGVVLAMLLGVFGMGQATAAPSAPPNIQWISSTEKTPWHELPVPTGKKSDPSTGSSISLDPKTTYQTIDGFGGCFNELGWEALLSLPVEKRQVALKALFAPDEANFTLGRAPIGANDFSLGWYSLDETPGDYAMEHFSIERNRESLIPFIKAAMNYQPKLGIWAVPWCPPSWMTSNGRYSHGTMKQDPQTLAAYALYFSKFVQAWRAEGINLYAIHPQNEPRYNDGIYPQCGWNGQELNRFLRDYLLPQLGKDQVKVQVWYGTIVNKDISDYVDPVLGDPKTVTGITGVGCQYGGRDSFLAIHEKYPDKRLAQTETECNGGENTWEQGLTTFRRIIEDTSHFASSYFFWNMVLDESGLSRWNWKQNSLLTVNRKTGTIIDNPEYFAMKHFSATVLSGARRIAVTGPFKNIVAFQNPDGSKVVQFENDTDQVVSADVNVGSSPARLEVPAKSMNTLTVR